MEETKNKPFGPKWTVEVKNPKERDDSEKVRAFRQGSRDQMDWMKRQIQYINFSEKYRIKYDLKKGEIYEFDFGINVNAEFSNRHYGVVLCDSNGNNPLVVVCPLKTNHNGAHPASDYDLGYMPRLNTTNSTVAVVNQIRTLDKIRIFTRKTIGVREDELSSIRREDIREENFEIIQLEEDKVDAIIDMYVKILREGLR